MGLQVTQNLTRTILSKKRKEKEGHMAEYIGLHLKKGQRQKVQTSSYNINESWRRNVQHGDYN